MEDLARALRRRERALGRSCSSVEVQRAGAWRIGASVGDQGAGAWRIGASVGDQGAGAFFLILDIKECFIPHAPS